MKKKFKWDDFQSYRIKSAFSLMQLFVFLFFSIQATAFTNDSFSVKNFDNYQISVISGTIKNGNGTPLPGVHVIAKGTKAQTLTDFDGNYKLAVTDKTLSLIFTYIGQKTQEVLISGRSTIDVTMEEDTALLDEVVVIGYGAVKRNDLTGAVSSITKKDIEESPVTTVSELFEGKSSGVFVTTGDAGPGGGINIQVRGTSTFTGSSEPLYIIDGFPVDSDNNGQAISGGLNEGNVEGQDGNNIEPNALAFLNPADIENIEILKDAAATAIYGSRGANGVVIITTKRGKVGKPEISLDYSVEISKIANKIDRLTGPQFAASRNAREIRNGTDPADVLWNGRDEFHPAPENAENNDWQDIIYRNAFTRNLSLDVKGGNENTKYLLSGKLIDQEGIIRETGRQDIQLRLNLDNQIGNLDIKTSVLLSNQKRQRSVTGSGIFGYNIVRNALNFNPIINPEWRDPNNPDLWYTETINSEAPNSNPLKILQNIDDETNTNRLLANSSLTYHFTNTFSFTGSAGLDYSDGIRNTFFNNSLTLSGNPVQGGGQGNSNTNTVTRSNYNGYFSYLKSFNNGHNLNIVTGSERTVTEVTRVNIGVADLITGEFGLNNFALGNPERTQLSNFKSTPRVLVGFFGRFNYDYKGKYFVSLNARQDGSSSFSKGKEWSFFPSVALAWKPTEEAFLQNQKVLSDLKIRGSLGQTGNGDLPVNSSTALYIVQTGITNLYSFDNQIIPAAFADKLGNKNLESERTTQFDIGVDARFLKNRYNFNFDYYRKDTDQLVLPVVIPQSTGFTTALQNLGAIRNTGVELGFDAKIINKKDFKVSVNANITFQKTIATDIGGDVGQDAFGDGFREFGGNRLRRGVRVYEGRDAGQFYGFQVGGVYPDQAAADAGALQRGGTSDPDDSNFRRNNQEGFIYYKDVSGPDGTPDGVIDDFDQTSLGKITPDYFYGFTTRLSYKDFSFSIFFQGVKGNSLYALYNGDDNLSFDPDNPLAVAGSWTPENRNTNVPVNRAGGNGRIGPNDTYTSEHIQDASYIRLKSVRLSYRLPSDLKTIGGLNIFLTGSNLLTFTKYGGYNPGVSSGGRNAFGGGFDNGNYPLSKGVTLGFNFNF